MLRRLSAGAVPSAEDWLLHERTVFCRQQVKDALGILTCRIDGIACPYINLKHAELGFDGRGDGSCEYLDPHTEPAEPRVPASIQDSEGMPDTHCQNGELVWFEN